MLQPNFVWMQKNLKLDFSVLKSENLIYQLDQIRAHIRANVRAHIRVKTFQLPLPLPVPPTILLPRLDPIPL